jgi:hypothetical protein
MLVWCTANRAQGFWVTSVNLSFRAVSFDVARVAAPCTRAASTVLAASIRSDGSNDSGALCVLHPVLQVNVVSYLTLVTFTAAGQPTG